MVRAVVTGVPHPPTHARRGGLGILLPPPSCGDSPMLPLLGCARFGRLFRVCDAASLLSIGRRRQLQRLGIRFLSAAVGSGRRRVVRPGGPAGGVCFDVTLLLVLHTVAGAVALFRRRVPAAAAPWIRARRRHAWR